MAIKRKLTEKPLLYTPDYNAKFILQTDSSEKGLGVALAHQKDNEVHPIIFLSRPTGGEVVRDAGCYTKGPGFESRVRHGC